MKLLNTSSETNITITAGDLKEFAITLASDTRKIAREEWLELLDEIDKTYTVNEVCDILKVTKVTLYRWNKDGKLIPIKAGKRVSYTAASIKDFIKNKKS